MSVTSVASVFFLLQTSLSSNIASALCLLLSSVVLSMVRPSMHAGYVGEDYG